MTPAQQKLKSEAYRLASDASRVYRVLCIPAFWEVYTAAPAAEQAKVGDFVKKGGATELREWFKKHISGSKMIGEKTVDELRRMASELGISGYHLMRKPELLSAVARST